MFALIIIMRASVWTAPDYNEVSVPLDLTFYWTIRSVSSINFPRVYPYKDRQITALNAVHMLTTKYWTYMVKTSWWNDIFAMELCPNDNGYFMVAF